MTQTVLNLNMSRQFGFQLPVVLLVLSLVLFATTRFAGSVVATQQEVSAEADHAQALRSVESVLQAAEAKIKASEEEPFVIVNLEEGADGAHLDNDTVWASALNDYDLDHQNDLMSGDLLSWREQSRDWWARNGIEVLAEDNSVRGWYTIAYLNELPIGSNIANARQYFGARKLVFYRVTAKGVGDRGASVVIETNVAQGY